MAKMDLLIQVLSLLVYLGSVITTIFLIMKKIDRRIDEKVNMNPFIRDSKLIAYKISELKPDIETIKSDISKIQLKLARSRIGEENDYKRGRYNE